MTFAEHLEELRARIIISLIAFGVAFLVAFGFQEELLRVFTRPYRAAVTEINASLRAKYAKEHHARTPTLEDRTVDELEKAKALPPDAIDRLRKFQRDETGGEAPQLPSELNAIELSETFGAYMQVCTIAALLVSAPILLFQLWRFIGAGLYDHERGIVMRVLPWSLLLFFTGLSFGFFVLAKISIQFLASYGESDVVQPHVSIGAYFGLLFLLLLVMGLVFQIPLIMTILSSVGLVKPAWFRSKRRHCILAIFIIAAVITPPDYVSQLIVAFPMLLLFEAGIFLAAKAQRRRDARLAEQAAAQPAGERQP